MAFYSEADVLGFGGQAGGGKSDLALGLAARSHYKGLIFRREYPQLTDLIERSREILGGVGTLTLSPIPRWKLPGGRTLEFGAVQYLHDVGKYKGRPHDLLIFDEAAEFAETQVRFLMGWLRTTRPDHKCRAVLTFNPPTTTEGEWILNYFGPWLDPQHSNPAAPGELRWYAMIDGAEVERPDGQPFEHNGERITPQSRTFIPAKLSDNPHLERTGYRTTLQNLPEPLRSQLLHGDFTVGRDDDPWQVIPTAWIKQAQARWTPEPPGPLECLGADMAYGGGDKFVISPRHGSWFGPLLKYPGSATPDGKAAAALIVAAHQGDAEVNIDAIGYGASGKDILKMASTITVHAINVGAKSEAKDKSGKLGFRNLRSQLYWQLREALDPTSGQDIALPPDPELLSDLAAARWELLLSGIAVKPKDEIKKVLGRSPDCGDAVLFASYLPKPKARWQAW